MESEITRLQEEIRSRDNDIHLAAIYGKQLFEKNAELSSKIDELLAEKELSEQEKHSLRKDLDKNIEALKSLASELELQIKQSDNLEEKLQITEKEVETLHKKIENMTKENQYFKKLQENLDVENKYLVDKIKLLEKEIKHFEDQAEKSLCLVDKDESQELQMQLNTYMLNNKELHDTLSKSLFELETAKKNENHLLEMVHELEETVDEKNLEISAGRAEILKAKEEIEELQGEIEILKFDQVDVNRRGNSVFAELDDRRNLVEREYKILRKKYDKLHKDYTENMKELDKARGQTFRLQNMASRDYQQAYIDKLEDSLSSSRKEIGDLMHKLSKLVKNNIETAERDFTPKNEYDYLRVMLKQQRQKEKELQNEIATLTSKNIYDNDKVIETQCLLYKAKEDLSSAKQEITELKHKIKDLECGIMHKLPNETKTLKPRIEILDGFKPLTKNKENEVLDKSKLDPFADMDIVPGELELGEDGFQQVKPPRKSNRFMLQEFNRIKLDEEETTGPLKSSCKNDKFDEESNKKENVADQTEKTTHKFRNHSKVTSNRNGDKCAQQ